MEGEYREVPLGFIFVTGFVCDQGATTDGGKF